MKKIILLGATGSLGQQALEILEKHRKYFEVEAISGYQNEKLLNRLSKKHKVPKTFLTFRDGKKSLLNFIKKSRAEIVINVVAGIAGIEPTIAALQSDKIVLLGNKESIVAEGEKVMKLAQKTAEKLKIPHALIPLDSEHNAIFEIFRFLEKKFSNPSILSGDQSLPKFTLKRIILPCSGGPFWRKTKAELEKITPTEASTHPRWKMGRKISIESATLLNKGFEILEAHYLFSLPLSKISVKIHPECQIHGMVEVENPMTPQGHAKPPPSRMKSTRFFAYLGHPDMREHIENALLRAINLTPPTREIHQINISKFNLKNSATKTLSGIKIVLDHFKNHPKSMKKFLQKEEKIIKKFLQNQISFTEIFTVLS